MGTELIEKTETGIVSFMTPTDFESALRIAETLAKSELVPTSYQKKPADIVVAMAHGAELGMQPIAALQSIAVINGRPSLWGDAVLGLVKTKPDYEYIRETFDTPTMTATCIVKRKGEPEHIATFCQKDAETAGLWGVNTWKKYPQRMLQMRARGFAIRSVFPHHLKGIPLAEEAADYPPNAPQYDTATIIVSDSPAPSEPAPQVEAIKMATYEQLEQIRKYGIEKKRYSDDDGAVKYINSKSGIGIASLYELDEAAATAFLSKMYPNR